jgi:hypothetical protein
VDNPLAIDNIKKTKQSSFFIINVFIFYILVKITLLNSPGPLYHRLFKCFIVLSCFANTIQLNAQSTIANPTKLYSSFESYLYNKPELASQIKIKRRGKRTEDPGGNNYAIYTGKEYRDDAIKENFFAAERNDSMYINCRTVIGIYGYSYVRFRSSKYLHFMADRSNIKGTTGIKKVNNDMAMAGAMFGALGAATYSALKESNGKRFVHYLLNLTTGEVILMNRGLMRKYKDLTIEENDPAFAAYLDELIESTYEQDS